MKSIDLTTAFAHPHAPNWELLHHVSTVVVVHLWFAVAAFVIGTVQIAGAIFFGLGGKMVHRIFGWIWVTMIMTVAISSFFIHMINPAGFSLVHIFSVVTVISVPVMVWAARTHRIDLHKRVATRTFAGALIVAGIFTFFPGRLMWQMFFG